MVQTSAEGAFQAGGVYRSPARDELRLQRWRLGPHKSWGVTPGSD
jgi:hypothetical protein